MAKSSEILEMLQAGQVVDVEYDLCSFKIEFKDGSEIKIALGDFCAEGYITVDIFKAKGEGEAVYRYAGKIGPWARNADRWGDRYLDVGLQGRPEYLKIVSAEKGGDTWREVKVQVEFGQTVYRGCGTNIYKKVTRA